MEIQRIVLEKLTVFIKDSTPVRWWKLVNELAEEKEKENVRIRGL